MSEVVALIDRFFWVILLVCGVTFTAFCAYIFSVSVKSTKFEDVYSAEKLQLLASLDPNAKKEKKQIAAKAKKSKRAKKPKDGNNEPAPQANTAAESSEPEPESVSTQAEHNASHEESDGSSKPSTSTDTVATTASNKKKPNKKSKPAKKPAPEPVEPTPSPEPVHESVSEPIHVVIEEAAKQQSAPPKKEKTRTKRAAQREDVTDIDEDKFIRRVAILSDLEPEYLNFITQFIGRANADKYEFHGVQEQVFKLQSKLKESDKTIWAKDSDLAKIKNELVTARNGIHDLHKLQKAVADEKAKADALKKQLEQSESSLRAALAKADNKEEVAQLKAKIAELEASLQAAAASKAQVQKLQAELAAAKKAPVVDESANEKLVELQKRVDAAEAAKEASAQQIAELQAELAAEKQDAAQSTAELETLTFELDALQTGFIEKENLAQANNTFAEERKQHLAEIEDLKNQNTNKDGAITKLNHELRKAYNDSREHLAEVEEVKKALATSKEAELSLTARLDVLGKKLAESDEYTHDSKSKIHELQNEIKSMEREKDDLKQQLREERERVEQFEKVETVAPVTSAPPAEDSATKEQIEKLEKEFEAAQKKIAELEAAQKESSAQTPAIEQEIAELKAKKNELAETNVKLAAAVRDAEAKAKQIEADATAANATTLKTVVDTLGEALSSAGIKTNPNVPSSVDGLQKWIQSVAGAVKKATAKPKEATPAPEAAKPTTSSADSEEVEQLKEKVADYEERLASVAKHIEAIEGAYHEYKHDQEKKFAALQARS
uniref:Rib_recp_KP_reg domain-containing protein n=1 Tax=Panagrellus redivivus TaxID=6233 RepID=A0A7E4VQY4_PANRE